MATMLVTPLPSNTGQDVLAALETVRQALERSNGLGNGRPARQRIEEHVRWATDASRQLRRRISADDIARLVFTRGFYAMLEVDLREEAVASLLLSVETDTRLEELDAAISALRAEISRWQINKVLVVLDTSVYLHDEKIENLDLGDLLQVREQPIHILIPMVIVDELDTLKQSGKREIRWRAAYTLAFINGCLDSATLHGRVRPEDFSALAHGGIPRGEITAEVVLDRPGHNRLPIADDEIVDRALAIQRIAGRGVHVVTFDTGMQMRARGQDLTVYKRDQPEEPETTSGTRKT